MAEKRSFWLVVLRVLKNKYVFVTLLFLFLMTFVEQNSWIVTSRLRRQVKELKEEECELHKAMEEDSVSYGRVCGDMEALEHYGREEYFLKRADEDVFVFDD